MSQPETPQSTAASASGGQLEGGAYEIIRNRLATHAATLRSRLGELNNARKDVFGSIETALVNTDRITTANNCIPRDMVPVGRRFLFGYNVHFGLRTERHLADVFAIYEFSDGHFHEQPLDLIQEERFQKDFHDVYRFYRDAVFSRFFLKGPHLYMVFRVGRSVSDIKTFKWAIDGDRLKYIDNRSDHEVTFPPQHEFEWVRTHRDLHQSGTHPHISIEDRVFVETVGGDLTIKVENNTESGEGILSEPVDDPDQTLDDAEVLYASLDNLILLKIRPYQEKNFRYFVFNEKLQQATRLDAIAEACVRLPDDHGLIYSSGYYLQAGDSRRFDSDLAAMMFDRRIAAPNGEDYLYVFTHRESGTYALLAYNLISQEVSVPLVCNGFSFFENGELLCFRCHEEPQKHHAIQIWQTPFVGENHVPETHTDSYLYRIGNREIVRGMAECQELLNLLDKDDSWSGLYVDVVKKSGDVLDSYFWLDRQETCRLDEPLREIRGAASAAVEEFEKVVRVRRETEQKTAAVASATTGILKQSNNRRYETIDDFVSSLGDLRRVRGDIISLRELRYSDSARITRLEEQVTEQTERISHRCVQFLLSEGALDPYAARVAEAAAQVPHLEKVTEAKQVAEAIDTGAAELEMLIEIVSNLPISDATRRTQIIDQISAIFTEVNQARAALRRRQQELFAVEGTAEFSSQLKLLNQAVVKLLDVADTPEKCDTSLTRVMIQLEELEGRFAEFDEFVVQLSEKRDEIYNAFESRKLSLVEARNRRAAALGKAADRILTGIRSRAESLESISEINGYFAGDLMIAKVRDLVSQLEELDDSVRVDDIRSRLKSIQEDTVRQLKDRQELFVDGENIIRLGQHQFSVNTQPFDLTTVMHEDELSLHLTGTAFFLPLRDPRLEACRDCWNQELVSETPDIYRAEYAAYLMYQQLSRPAATLQKGTGPRPEEDAAAEESAGPQSLDDLRRLKDQELQAFVTKWMAPRYTEGYIKGVHDHDAARILRAMLDIDAGVGLLRYPSRARAMAALYWEQFIDRRTRTRLEGRIRGFGTVASLFPTARAQNDYTAELQQFLTEFAQEELLFPQRYVNQAAEYLLAELQDGDGWVISRTAADLCREFHLHLQHNDSRAKFDAAFSGLKKDPVGQFLQLRDWLEAWARATDLPDDEAESLDEAAVILLLYGEPPVEQIADVELFRDLEGMAGDHPRIAGGRYHLNWLHLQERLSEYEANGATRFREFGQLKKQLVDEAREEMRLDEFRPRVMTSFVRNRLIDEVYLPLIGANLARQIGAAGDQKRTDRMGLLLLISPPGYGKTTLMEYVANRLGIIFMKINGPALGHQVTSLDPAAAPNAGAREEIEKLNLSFEMGDNVMIYVDDIQHCHPEFLQKFISLCDAQRKIEGVSRGRTRTFDFRGKKVAVVMAGNPYTES
ncbi:MAG: DNA repair ATPase, partial [Planctomycetaceae bacterium]|nr:DNA repair ATPase [Planctomycetaceae bacterium]